MGRRWHSRVVFFSSGYMTIFYCCCLFIVRIFHAFSSIVAASTKLFDQKTSRFMALDVVPLDATCGKLSTETFGGL